MGGAVTEPSLSSQWCFFWFFFPPEAGPPKESLRNSLAAEKEQKDQQAHPTGLLVEGVGQCGALLRHKPRHPFLEVTAAFFSGSSFTEAECAPSGPNPTA